MKTTPIRTVGKIPPARFLNLVTIDAKNSVLRKVSIKNTQGYQ